MTAFLIFVGSAALSLFLIALYVWAGLSIFDKR